MARKKRHGTRMTFIPLDVGLALGTLADSVVAAGTMVALGEDFFVVGLKGTWSLRNPTVLLGPIDVGFAHGDLSPTEINEAITASQTDPDDIIAVERSRRPVRKVGSFAGVVTANLDVVLNDGAPITTRFKRSIGDGHTLDIWAKNNSGSALTTGGSVRFQGHAYGRWQR